MKKLQFDNPNNIYFTSDTHFGHINILKFCNRPFENIKEHDERLIENWNNKVSNDDIVFHLGDVGLGNPTYVKSLLEKLNGKIYLVIGNHDWRNIVKTSTNRFEEMTQQINMMVGEQHIILNHYPLLCFSGIYRKNPTWQLYGHVHSGPYSTNGLDSPRLKMCYATQYDVGVDNNDFAPISYAEVKEKIEQRIKNRKLDELYEKFRLGEITINELKNETGR